MTCKGLKRRIKLWVRDTFNLDKCHDRCDLRSAMWRNHLACRRLQRDMEKLRQVLEAEQANS